MIPLRPYQVSGIEEVRLRIASGIKRIVFVLATGGGKTVVASSIVASAVAKGSRVLFVAHRRELIRQAWCKLVRNGLAPSDVGVIMAGVEGKVVDTIAPPPSAIAKDEELWRLYARRRPAAAVQVASVDTIRMRAKPTADLVIFDEAHRSLSPSYVNLAAQYPDAVLLGLTATPYRSDNRGLGELYEDLVVIASPRVLVDAGFLVDPRVFTVPAAELPDLSRVKLKGGDYDEAQLAAAMDQANLVGDIVDHWKRLAAGVRTVAFAVNVDHSKHIAQRCREAGVPAEHLDGETPTTERDAILGRLERGETLIVSNCGVLCEGWDQPPVKCCILARPTKSTGLYLQQAGRILRPWQGQAAIILDHAGCALEHGLPTEDREFSLDPPKRRRRSEKDDAPSCKTCENCYAVLPTATRICPSCGHEFLVEERALEEAAGELVEVRAATIEEKRAAWDRLCAERGERKPGWVFHRYLEIFGVKPPSGWRVPAREDESPSNDDEATRRAYWVKCAEQASDRGHDPMAAKLRYRARYGTFPPAEWSTLAPSDPRPRAPIIQEELGL